jgi:hypothetical protein
LTPLFRASPASAGMPRSSAAPPSSNPSTESIRVGRSRRRHCHFLYSQPSSAASNSSPPAILRPSRPRRHLPGEAMVRQDPSPLPFPRCSAARGWSPPAPGSRSGWVFDPVRPASVASLRGLWPPQSASAGQKAPGTKSHAECFYFSEKLLQEFKTCKIYRKLSVYRKNANDLSKCSEK